MNFNGLDSKIWHSPCCKSSLIQNKQHLQCQACDITYPIFKKHIPILVREPHTHLAQTITALKQEHQQIVVRLLKLKKHMQVSPNDRNEHLNQLHKVHDHNTRLLSDAITSLSSLDQTLQDAVNHAPYNKLNRCLNYLRRDWSNHPPSQKEVACIKTRVIQLIEKFCDARENSLFLGAGLGRFAYDLSHFFENTIAVDNAMMMGYIYEKIQQEDIDFYHIKLRHTTNNAQQYKLIHATRQESTEKISHHRLPTYAIADANNLPLADQSVSVVLSIYFTDVVPLTQFWPEVKRVLKPGGVFIHYGPLGYHFDTIHESYSADDIRAKLSSEGFELHDEQWDKLGHLSHTQEVKELNNWSFAAIRRDRNKK